MRRVQKNPGKRASVQCVQCRLIDRCATTRTAMPEVIAIDGLQKTLDRLLDVLKKVRLLRCKYPTRSSCGARSKNKGAKSARRLPRATACGVPAILFHRRRRLARNHRQQVLRYRAAPNSLYCLFFQPFLLKSNCYKSLYLNDERSKDLEKLQKHLRKMFAGLASLEYDAPTYAICFVSFLLLVCLTCRSYHRLIENVNNCHLQ